MNRSDFNLMILGKLKLKEAEKTNKLTIQGNRQIFDTFLSLFEQFDFWFNIVEPQKTNTP